MGYLHKPLEAKAQSKRNREKRLAIFEESEAGKPWYLRLKNRTDLYLVYDTKTGEPIGKEVDGVIIYSKQLVEGEPNQRDCARLRKEAIDHYQLASSEERARIDAEEIRKHEQSHQAMKSEVEQDVKPPIEPDIKLQNGKDVQPKLEQAVKPKVEPGVEPRIPFNTELKPTPKAVPKIEQDDDKDGLAALDALESEAKEFNKDAEIDRILKAFKLDAYAVLDLQPGVPESDIKITYRKKSLLIHPDKTTNPQAPEAFDRLKKAQTELMDEKARARLDECIADARMLLMRELKLTVDSEEIKNMDGAMKEAWRKKTVEVLIDNEHRRRKQLKAQMQEEGREQRRVDEEVEARKRKREHEVAWEQSREGRIGSWRDFQGKAGGEKEGGKKKKGKLKVLG
ncbi:hypothetical protein MMC18_003565 [Xylographa bjoerkii]|nr:hypothetical protein [Xylographa bjoerkii]